MRIIRHLVAVTLAAVLASCSTPTQIAYFQDHANAEQYMSAPTEIRLQPKDKLSILVNSQDVRLTNLFNLPIIAQQVGQDNATSQSRGLSGYTVDSRGYINFPVLGKISVQGMTREEVARKITDDLIASDLVRDPVVTVEFLNLSVSVLGEVTRPGRFNIDRDNFSVLDALSEAGDLTIYGRRDNIRVLRHEGDHQRSMTINLLSGADVCASPAYYLQQGDVVYVEPNETRQRQSTVNGNNIRSTSFWISLASLLTSIAVLIAK